jgi:hypothetical protein
MIARIRVAPRAAIPVDRHREDRCVYTCPMFANAFVFFCLRTHDLPSNPDDFRAMSPHDEKLAIESRHSETLNRTRAK